MTPSRRRSRSPEISVVIPTRGNPGPLQRCLASLADQQDPPPFELLVAAPPDEDVAHLVLAHFPEATVIAADAATAAQRRNELIELAAGELILFLDDDITVPPRFLATLADQARAHPDDQVFGGPNITPDESSRFQVVQGAVLSSLFGSGPVRRRYGPHPATEADERWFTLCNLAVRRSVARRFDADLVCAEENEFLDELRRLGGRMRYDPALWAAHERRSTLSGFARQMLTYGQGRGQLARRAPRSLRAAHLVPSLTLLAMVVLAITAAVSGPGWIAAIIGAYPLAVAVQSVAVAVRLRRPTTVVTAFGLIVVMHCAYGYGVLRGLLSARSTAAGRSSPAPLWTTLLILVRRQLSLLRKRSVLGLLWPLVTPWVMLILYSFVFHSVLKVPIPRYGVYLFAGLLPWSFLSNALGTAVASLSQEPDLIRRRRFNYALLPLAVVVTASVYFLVTLIGFTGFLAVRGELRWATLPALVMPITSLYLFVGAAACVLALIDVYNRDLRSVLVNILTVWFFLVPIVYQQKMLSHRLLFTRSVDPANLIVGEFRDVLYSGRISHPFHYVVVLFVTGAMLGAATSLIARFSPALPKDI